MQTQKDEGSKITIAFVGLVYLLHKGGPKKKGLFKACFLKDIPDHHFSLCGDIKKVEDPKDQNWTLEVIRARSASSKIEAYPWFKNGFDRKNKDHPCCDYQWTVNFDDWYGPQGYMLDKKALAPVVKIRAGKFYTLCRTGPLGYKKGGVDQKEFGCMADITGVDIVLNRGDKLVLRSGSRNIIRPLEHNPKAGTRYIVFANLPPQHMIDGQTGDAREAVDPRDAPPTHFLNYYFAIPKPYEERYDFYKMEKHPQGCTLPEGISKCLETITKGLPPYYCGTSGGGGGSGS